MQLLYVYPAASDTKSHLKTFKGLGLAVRGVLDSICGEKVRTTKSTAQHMSCPCEHSMRAQACFCHSCSAATGACSGPMSSASTDAAGASHTWLHSGASAATAWVRSADRVSVMAVWAAQTHIIRMQQRSMGELVLAFAHLQVRGAQCVRACSCRAWAVPCLSVAVCSIIQGPRAPERGTQAISARPPLSACGCTQHQPTRTRMPRPAPPGRHAAHGPARPPLRPSGGSGGAAAGAQRCHAGGAVLPVAGDR
jgi:hypothetical protein